MASNGRLRVVEFVVWVAVVAASIVALAVGVGFATGSGLLGAKYALFVVGFLLFGVGSLALQPDEPTGEDRWVSFDDEETRVDEVVQLVPPLDDEYLPADERVGYDVKLFALSLVVLGVSALMEFGLGIRV